MSENIDSDVSIGAKPIGGVVDGEEDVDEFLGHMMMSTTGEVLVPREWLVEQFHGHSIPGTLLPSETTPWQAYRRAKNELLEGWDGSHYSVYNEKYDHHFDVKLRLEKSNSEDVDSSNVYVLYADVFMPEDIINIEEGDWRQNRLGFFDFEEDKEHGTFGVVPHMEVEKDGVHYDKWADAYQRFNNLLRKHKECNNGQDLTGILSKFRSNHTNAVSIRRAVDFIPARDSNTVEGLAAIWSDLNQYKDKGEKCEIATIPVINTESQRELIQDRAENMMETTVDDVVDEAFERFDMEDQATEIASTILEEMQDMESFAIEYNALLDAKMSIESILEQHMEDMSGEKEKVLERTLEQGSLEDY